MLKLAIAVPTYNEVNNVEALIESIARVSSQHPDTSITLFVLDDSSPDGTASFVEQVAPTLERDNFAVRVIVKPTKEGLGAAYIHGFGLILSEEFDHILQMDADLSHDPKYISGFIHQAHAGTPFVVASRYIPGGGTPDWSFRRKFLSRGGNIYARMVLSRQITDYTGGFNMFSSEILRGIQPQTISATGYGFILVLKYRALLAAKRVVELPIVFFDRTNGESKIPRNTLMQNFLLVPRIRAARGNV
jgi:dolichol-phosphate mannosyltransferase